ncbi:MAG: response regulator transcription factor [Chthoniobacteraceae bacterium]
MRILVVEDERKLAEFVANGLRAAKFEAEVVRDGDEAFRKLKGETYDGAVLDIMLPGRDGLSILRQLREDGNNIPIVLLTARGSVNERIEGLRLGADDYLPKPFSIDELVVRLQAVLRRVTGEKLTVLHYADVTLNLVTREVQRAGRLLDLSPREFELLEFFLRAPERVLGRMSIIEHVWGSHFDPGTNLVDQYVKRLRRKIEDGFPAKLIHTVPGSGYRFGPSR